MVRWGSCRFLKRFLRSFELSCRMILGWFLKFVLVFFRARKHEKSLSVSLIFFVFAIALMISVVFSAGSYGMLSMISSVVAWAG